MQYEKKDFIGYMVPGKVRAYTKNPSDSGLALQAAAHYAKKLNKPFAVLPGNSYGNAVWHIAGLEEDVTKYTGGFKTILGGGIVFPDGTTYRAEFV